MKLAIIFSIILSIMAFISGRLRTGQCPSARAYKQKRECSYYTSKQKSTYNCKIYNQGRRDICCCNSQIS